MFIKPAPGVKVRDDGTLRHLAEQGEAKPETNYWQRRLADGDVVLTTAPAPTPATNESED